MSHGPFKCIELLLGKLLQLYVYYILLFLTGNAISEVFPDWEKISTTVSAMSREDMSPLTANDLKKRRRATGRYGWCNVRSAVFQLFI